jgi:hypothetical protein
MSETKSEFMGLTNPSEQKTFFFAYFACLVTTTPKEFPQKVSAGVLALQNFRIALQPVEPYSCKI